jgi:hypothetical protein
VNNKAGDGHLSNLTILNDHFVFDTHSGLFYRVSETAAFIINELKWRNPPIATLTASYAQHYGVSQGIAERDVELFLNDVTAYLADSLM